MEVSAIITLLSGLVGIIGLIYTITRIIIKYLDLNEQYQSREKKIRKARYTRDSVRNVAKIALVIAGTAAVDDHSLKLAKQVYFGAVDDRRGRQAINDFDEHVHSLINKKIDILKDEIRRNTLLPIAGVTTDESD